MAASVAGLILAVGRNAFRWPKAFGLLPDGRSFLAVCADTLASAVSHRPCDVAPPLPLKRPWFEALPLPAPGCRCSNRQNRFGRLLGDTDGTCRRAASGSPARAGRDGSRARATGACCNSSARGKRATRSCSCARCAADRRGALPGPPSARCCTPSTRWMWPWTTPVSLPTATRPSAGCGACTRRVQLILVPTLDRGQGTHRGRSYQHYDGLVEFCNEKFAKPGKAIFDGLKKAISSRASRSPTTSTGLVRDLAPPGPVRRHGASMQGPTTRTGTAVRGRQGVLLRVHPEARTW